MTGTSRAGISRRWMRRRTFSSVEKAVKIAGLGRANLRMIEVDESFAMRPEALAQQIARDREAGLEPCSLSWSYPRR